MAQWLYDEYTASGVDYSQKKIAKNYDSRHGHFRDFSTEAALMRRRVNLRPSDRLIDLGCGTGALTIEHAAYCEKIDAVDVSESMLAEFSEKIDTADIGNISLHHAGFLTYRHAGDPADVVFSSIALHHLPDFWKVYALKNIYAMLRPGGLFYLFDVVFTFGVEQMDAQIERVLADMGEAAGHEAFMHIKNEYSTFDWLLEAMFRKTGFAIREIFDDCSFLRAYVLVRE